MHDLAVEIVIDKLRDRGFDVEVSDRTDRKSVTIIWDRLFYERERTVQRYDDMVSDEIIAPPPKINTDKNTNETAPLTWIQKWRANRAAESDANFKEAAAAHKKDG
jgi:hypothetical protein